MTYNDAILVGIAVTVLVFVVLDAYHFIKHWQKERDEYNEKQ